MEQYVIQTRNYLKMKYLIFTLLTFLAASAFSQKNNEEFFVKVDTFMFHYVTNGKVNYKAIKSNSEDLNKLILFIENKSLDSLDKNTKKAYLINAYNLYVIKQVISKYPLKSPMDVAGFFETTKFNVGGKKYTLNHIENNILRKEYKDPRLHFVLVCGAIGCPVIANFGYNPIELDAQLKSQTKKALNNSKFVYQNDKGVFLSEIFSWYKEDFGGSTESAVNYINKYRTKAFSKTANVQFYPYDWKLNEFIGKRNEYSIKTEELVIEKTIVNIDTLQVVAEKIDENTKLDDTLNTSKNELQIENIHIEKDSLFAIETIHQEELAPINDEEINLQTYTAGTLLRKGQFDFTLFNTIYTETKGNWLGNDFSGNRTSLFTSSIQILYGVSKSKRVNVGLELNYKTTANSKEAGFNRMLDVFTLQNNATRRSGLANVGLRAKVSPFKGVNDFSIQSTFYIPTIKSPEGYTNHLAGGDGEGNLTWSDWNRYVSWTQFFYVKSFNKFQLFTEVDLLYRRRVLKSQMDHLDLPATVIFSYFPTKKITFYGIGQYATRFLYNINPSIVNDWVQPMNYSTLGLGFKYQPKSNITIELLYTNFVRGVNTGLGSTFNLGIKILTK